MWWGNLSALRPTRIDTIVQTNQNHFPLLFFVFYYFSFYFQFQFFSHFKSICNWLLTIERKNDENVCLSISFDRPKNTLMKAYAVIITQSFGLYPAVCEDETRNLFIFGSVWMTLWIAWKKHNFCLPIQSANDKVIKNSKNVR